MSEPPPYLISKISVGPEVDGVLKAIHVAPGDAVKAGQVLFELV